MGSVGDVASRKVLIVEDDCLIAWELEAILSDAGYEVVGPVGDVPGALAVISGGALDGALLDVNLGDHSVAPAADALSTAQVPFVFVTGHSEEKLPPQHRARPVVAKPFEPSALLDVLTRAIG